MKKISGLLNLKNKLYPITYYLVAATLVASCGGGENTATPIESTGFRVQAVVPDHDASSVEAESVIEVQLSDDIFSPSITDASIVVRDASGQAINGNLTIENSTTIRFTPDEKLTLSESYQSQISSSISNLSGASLNDDYEWTFRTRAGQWTMLDFPDHESTQETSQRQIAIDDNGNGIAVWRNNIRTDESDVWAARYNKEEDGWSTPQILDDSVGHGRQPEIAMYPNGDAIAIWRQLKDAKYQVWSSRYTIESDTWSIPERLDNSPNNTSNATIEIGQEGDAIAIWQSQESGSSITSIWATHYDTETDAWSNAQLLENEDSTLFSSPEIAIDTAGNAIAAWRGNDNNVYSVWTAHYDHDNKTWTTASTLQTPVFAGSAPLLRVNHQDNFLLIWQRQINENISYWFSRYDPNREEWELPIQLENISAQGALHETLSIDKTGNMIFTWIEFSNNTEHLWSVYFDTESNTWGSPIKVNDIEDDDGENQRSVFLPSVAMQPNGSALAVWVKSVGQRDDIWFARFDALSKQWQPLELFISETQFSHSSPMLALNKKGEGLLIWSQFDYVTYNGTVIRSATFD